MKTKPIQRTLSLISAIAMLLTVLAVPAFAAPSATASLDAADRSVLAGAVNQVFDITVTNTGSTGGLLGLQGVGETINAVVVQAPEYFADLGTQGIEGWEAKELSNNRVLFTATGSGIAPGSSAVFPVPGPVGNFAQDDQATFSVTVSSNRGTNLAPAGPASAGALTSLVEVLNLPSFQLTSPDGAIDLTVTDGQSNVLFDVVVENLATEALTVTPTIVKKSGGSSVTTSIVRVNGAPHSGSTVQIPTKDSAVVTFSAAFATVGSALLNVAATAPGADTVGAPALDRNISVQQATNILFNNSTPEVAPVGGPGTLSVNFNKSGAPTGTLATSTLELINGTTTKTAVVPDVAFTGGGQTLSLDYPVVFTLADAEGLYDARFTHRGLDDNGAIVEVIQTVEDIISFDKSLPSLTNLQTLLPDGTAVTNEVPAAGNGRRIQVKGDVLDGGVKCDACTVTLQLVTGAGQNVGERRTLTNTGGSFDTTFSVAGLPAGIQAGSLLPQLSATDVAGNGPANTTAPSVPFDTREAKIEMTFPVTGGIAEANDEGEVLDRVDVIFDEGVAVPTRTLSAQWAVTNNRVESATLQSVVLKKDLVVSGTENRSSATPTAVSKTFPAGTRIWFARLDLASNLGGNDLPTVTYDPDANLGGSSSLTSAQTRIFDRVDLRTLKGVRGAFDNIAPALPILSQVNGLGTQWDDDKVKKFFTRGGETQLTLTDVAPGTLVKVFVVDGGVRSQVGTFENSGTSGSTVQFPVNFGATERQVTVELQAFDSGAKTSPVATYGLVVDTTPPAALSAAFDGSDKVTITASDVIPYGAEAGLDFVVEALDNRGRKVVLQVQDVAKPAGSEGDPQSLGADAFLALRKRVLTVDTTTYDPSQLTLTGVRYDAQYGEDGIYIDRAGNKLESPSTFAF